MTRGQSVFELAAENVADEMRGHMIAGSATNIDHSILDGQPQTTLAALEQSVEAMVRGIITGEFDPAARQEEIKTWMSGLQQQYDACTEARRFEFGGDLDDLCVEMDQTRKYLIDKDNFSQSELTNRLLSLKSALKGANNKAKANLDYIAAHPNDQFGNHDKSRLRLEGKYNLGDIQTFIDRLGQMFDLPSLNLCLWSLSNGLAAYCRAEMPIETSITTASRLENMIQTARMSGNVETIHSALNYMKLFLSGPSNQ